MTSREDPSTAVRGHDAPTRLISVAGALSALLVLFLHAWLGPRYESVNPAEDLFSSQLSTIAGLTVASFLTTAPSWRRAVYLAAFPAALVGVLFPWLHTLAPSGTTSWRMLNALTPVGDALLSFGVTWALRVTAADDAARSASTRRSVEPSK